MKPGDYILMEKNAAYFKDGFKGDPNISKIKFRTIKDGNTRAAELMTGAIDWIWDVPKDQAERIKANPAVVVENAKTLRVSYLQFDVHGVSGQKFFTDKRVRQAVAHAIDRESLTKNLVGPGLGGRRTRACHPDQFACSSDVPKYAYDPAKAKALLKEAGFAGRLRVRSLRLPGPRVHRSGDRRSRQGRHQAQAQLRAIHGLPRERAQGQDADRARHLGLQLGARRLGHDRAFLPHGPDDLTKDPEVKKLIEEADALTDPDKRKAAWQKALARIAAEAYWVPLFTYAKYYAFSKDLDFKPTSDEIPQFFAAKWK